MGDRLLKIYHSLPASLRTVPATLRGYYLAHWRYGPETERLVQEALDRESWTPGQWKAWHEERLAYVLHRAATRVPYYREQWVLRRRRGDKTSWDYLENWPILEKDSVRENPSAFVAEDCNLRMMFHEHTSGTTGKPLNLWLSKDTVRKWYALAEARCQYRYGVTRHDRWAMVGGQLVTPVSQQEPPFWVWNKGLNQLYMSSYHLAPKLILSYLEAMSHHRVIYLYGYASSLYALAQAVLESGRQDIGMAVAITNAEPVYDYQRATIAQAFKCPVRETYGMTEIVAAASECTSGRLHLWPEAGWVEVLDNGHPLPFGTLGDLVCTGLLNVDMPLIRYRTGDRGALRAGTEICECKRTLPTIGRIEGRIDDLLYTTEGRRVGRLDPIFKGDLPLLEAQIIQEALNSVRVRYVPAAGFANHHERLMIERMRSRIGPVNVIMEPLDELPRGPNGKFRAVICNLSKEEKESLK